MITGIFGTKGSGKTTLIKKLIEKNKLKNLYSIDLLNSFGEFEIVNCFDIYELLQKIKENNKTKNIILDEIYFFQNKNLEKLFLISRHLKVNIIYTTQRTALIRKTFINLSDNFIIMKHNRKQDIINLQKEINLTDEEIDKIISLEKYKYYIKIC